MIAATVPAKQVSIEVESAYAGIKYEYAERKTFIHADVNGSRFSGTNASDVAKKVAEQYGVADQHNVVDRIRNEVRTAVKRALREVYA